MNPMGNQNNDSQDEQSEFNSNEQSSEQNEFNNNNNFSNNNEYANDESQSDAYKKCKWNEKRWLIKQIHILTKIQACYLSLNRLKNL